MPSARALRPLLLAFLALIPAIAIGILAPERAQAANFTVDSPVDAVDASPGDGACASAAGDCTLRAAIQETNALPGADVITLPAGTYVLSIVPGGVNGADVGDLNITDDVTITGGGLRQLPTTIVDGNLLDRAFDIDDPVSVTMALFTITNRRRPRRWRHQDHPGRAAARSNAPHGQHRHRHRQPHRRRHRRL